MRNKLQSQYCGSHVRISKMSKLCCTICMYSTIKYSKYGGSKSSDIHV